MGSGPGTGPVWAPIWGPVWGHRLLFVALFLALSFLRLLPLNTAPGALPGPDLLLCLIFAWTTRRPDFLPFWLVALVVLTDDLLLGRPPGLWAALVVAGTEFFRSRVTLTRELSFAAEWLVVAGVMLGAVVLYRLIGNLVLIPQAPFGFAIVQLVWSIICYPAAVALSYLAFGLRKPAQGEVDDRGRRL